MNKFTDKDEQKSPAYDIKVEEKTKNTFENKENSFVGYFQQLLRWTYERACAEQEVTIKMMKYIVDIYSSKIK